MHDPLVEAFSIRRPWPQVSKLNREYKTTFRGVFWRFAGREFYWPSLITVWHAEPEGRDSWKRHPHHWEIQFHPWQHFRRWAFTIGKG